PLRAAGRPAPLPGRDGPGDPAAGAHRGAGVAPPPGAVLPAGPRDRLPEVSGQGPAGRYQSAAALADDLGRFRNGEPIHARPPGPFGRLVKWARRRPAVATLLAVSGLTALALLAVLVVGDLRIRQKSQQTEQALRAEIEARDRLTQTLERERQTLY